MVHYIRLLKPPRQSSPDTISTTVTITTDLGESFYPSYIKLYAYIYHSHPNGMTDLSKDDLLVQQGFEVRPSCRATVLKLKVPQLVRMIRTRVRMVISACEVEALSGGVGIGGGELGRGKVPKVVSAWSMGFEVGGGLKEGKEAERRVGRVFEIGYRDEVVAVETEESSENGNEEAVEREGARQKVVLKIWEEMGESIARHVWDAALALISHISLLTSSSPSFHPSIPSSVLQTLLTRTSTVPLNIIELGTGVGIVGLSLASLLPNAKVLLTDLPEAMEILSFNIAEASLATGTQATSSVQDWDEPLSEEVKGRKWDLLIVSDCTYNVDSLAALVKTIGRIVREEVQETRAEEEREGGTLVVVGLKRRHESESKFFELMEEEGLKIAGREVERLSSKEGKEDEMEEEVVEIYYFRLRRRDSGVASLSASTG